MCYIVFKFGYLTSKMYSKIECHMLHIFVPNDDFLFNILLNLFIISTNKDSSL